MVCAAVSVKCSTASNVDSEKIGLNRRNFVLN